MIQIIEGAGAFGFWKAFGWRAALAARGAKAVLEEVWNKITI